MRPGTILIPDPDGEFNDESGRVEEILLSGGSGQLLRA